MILGKRNTFQVRIYSISTSCQDVEIILFNAYQGGIMLEPIAFK